MSIELPEKPNPAAHKIDKREGTEKIILFCVCGWEKEVTDSTFIPAVGTRHYLHEGIWPFPDDKRPYKWPHNTPEDDALGLRE